MQGIAGRLIMRERIPELLRNPGPRQMGGDRGVNESSTVMPEDHQHEQQPERDSRHDERGVSAVRVLRLLRGTHHRPTAVWRWCSRGGATVKRSVSTE